MFIVPFIHKVTTHNDINVNVIKLLTVGGKNLWEENDSLNVDNDILTPNDIYRTGNIIKLGKKVQLCEVDINKTNIGDFYKWEELDINDRDTFCWRTFIILLGNNGSNWLDTSAYDVLDGYSVKEFSRAISSRK